MATREARQGGLDALAACGLSLGLTWAMQAPFVGATLAGREPAGHAMALLGLSAFGPALAAVCVGALRGGVRGVFGGWRAPVGWVLLALVAPALLHVPGQVIERALGGSPAAWLRPPASPEMIAAMIVFPLGEEMGWRGFVHPRLVDWLGGVRGSLVLGAVWGIWHVPSLWLPGAEGVSAPVVLRMTAEMCALALVFAWFVERSGRGLWVAIALHVGLHLDNVARLPESEWRLRALHLGVLAIAGAAAGWSLSRGTGKEGRG